MRTNERLPIGLDQLLRGLVTERTNQATSWHRFRGGSSQSAFATSTNHGLANDRAIINRPILYQIFHKFVDICQTAYQIFCNFVEIFQTANPLSEPAIRRVM